MAEDKNQFTSIYGDAEDEFEIEDVSDETLTIPTDEVRAAREEEIATEAEEQAPSHADEEPEEARSVRDSEEPDEDARKPADEPAEPFSEDEEAEPYTDEELDGVTFEDSDARHSRDREPASRIYDEDERDAQEERDLAEPDPYKVSVLSYIGHAILFTIPVIGTVLMLVYIISDNKNPHLRHLAQIWLVTLIIVVIGLLAAAYMFGLVV